MTIKKMWIKSRWWLPAVFAAIAAVTAAPALAESTTAPVPTSAPPVLFPQSSFDSPISAQPVSSSSAGLVSELVSQYQTHYGTIGVNRMAVFTVPADQPLVQVNVQSGCWDFRSATGPGVPIPRNAYTSGGSDSEMVVNQPSTNSSWELWKASPNSDGTWTACWGGRLDPTTSTAVFPYPFGVAASGISLLATTITESDVASGNIDHAIALDIADCNGSVFPADRTDCSAQQGAPSEGTWFRMPASIPMPAGLTPFAQMVFKALQTYGMVAVDHAGAVMLIAERSADWTFQGHTGMDPITASWQGKLQYQVLNGIPWSQLQVIQPPQG